MRFVTTYQLQQRLQSTVVDVLFAGLTEAGGEEEFVLVEMHHFVENISTQIEHVGLGLVNTELRDILHLGIHSQEDISDVSVVFTILKSLLESFGNLLGLKIL